MFLHFLNRKQLGTTGSTGHKGRELRLEISSLTWFGLEKFYSLLFCVVGVKKPKRGFFFSILYFQIIIPNIFSSGTLAKSPALRNWVHLFQIKSMFSTIANSMTDEVK